MEPFNQVEYQGIVASPVLRQTVERHATRLERFHERIAACRIAVQRWYQHHGQGSSYRVAIELALPNEKLSVTREAGVEDGVDALESTLGAAFEEAETVLQQRALPAAPTMMHGPRLSAAARRLHPLHGRAPEDEAPASATE